MLQNLNQIRRFIKQFVVQNVLQSTITSREENLSVYRESRKSNSVQCPNLPLTLQVEVTRACNLSCQMCNVHHNPKSGKSISNELLEATFDLAKTSIAVYPFGLGEPLLYSKIAELIGKYKSLGNITALISNGMLLNEEMAEKLIVNGLDNLTISFDAATPDLLVKIRKGANFHIISQNILALNRIKKSFKVNNPTLSLSVVVQRSNFLQLPQIIELAEKWSIPSINLVPITIHEHIPNLESETLSHVANWREILDVCHEEAKKRQINIQTQVLSFVLDKSSPASIYKGVIPCPEPFHFMAIGVDGGLFPCCHWSLEGPLAKFPNVDLKDAWKNKKWQSLRSEIISNNYSALCEKCISLFSRPISDSNLS